MRAYGARVAGQWGDKLTNALALLGGAVRDQHQRVRLEAVVASTYLSQVEAVLVATEALEHPHDRFLDYALRQSVRAQQPRWAGPFAAGALKLATGGVQAEYLRSLALRDPITISPGQSIYEMACLPCHQPEGRGLPGVYPPLVGSDWVKGDATRLARILLHGLKGPIQVGGRVYGGGDAVPMPSMAGLEDGQIAAVLSYVRKEFGGVSGEISIESVRKVRLATAERADPWTAEELRATKE